MSPINAKMKLLSAIRPRRWGRADAARLWSGSIRWLFLFNRVDSLHLPRGSIALDGGGRGVLCNAAADWPTDSRAATRSFAYCDR